jgi:hypothetical protein
MATIGTVACRISFASVFLGLMLASAFAEATAPEEAPDYDTLVAAVKSGQDDIDYGILREAYARSSNYDPYGVKMPPSARDLFSVANAGNCQKAVVIAESVLRVNFTYYDAHLILAACSKKLGNDVRERQEHKIAIGLMKSILASGDGKSPETAFAVVSIAEEYNTLRILKLRELKQALVNHEGHAYDLFEARRDGSDVPVTLYFRIDSILAALNRELHPH